MKKRNYRLLLFLSVLLITGFLATSLASFFVSRESLRNQISEHALPLTSDNIYSEIQRDLLLPVHISSLMATDTFLRDWVINGESGSDKIIRYLKDIQLKYNTFTSFFVSERTHVYYQADQILKHVDPDEPRDEWYFRIKASDDGDYEINVDPDMAHEDTMTIFVNYKVYDYEGNYIGATGVGLAVTVVKSQIEMYQEKYGRQIYFVDRSGDIVLHGDSFPVEITNIHDIEELVPLIDEVFATDSSSLDYYCDGKKQYLNTRYIPEFDLYLFVEQSDNMVIKSIVNTLLINLAICMVITLLVLVITNVTVSTYQRRMEEMVDTDALTGAYNRGAFELILDQAFLDAHRSNRIFSIILLDIDFFKAINDSTGHLAGDTILFLLTDRISRRLRESDVLCRWGGEEFIVLLRDCGADDALNVAETIRVSISDSVFKCDGRELQVTASLGIAQYSPSEDKTGLIRRADNAMYAAKNAGRNQSKKA